MSRLRSGAGVEHGQRGCLFGSVSQLRYCCFSPCKDGSVNSALSYTRLPGNRLNRMVSVNTLRETRLRPLLESTRVDGSARVVSVK